MPCPLWRCRRWQIASEPGGGRWSGLDARQAEGLIAAVTPVSQLVLWGKLRPTSCRSFSSQVRQGLDGQPGGAEAPAAPAGGAGRAGAAGGAAAEVRHSSLCADWLVSFPRQCLPACCCDCMPTNLKLLLPLCPPSAYAALGTEQSGRSGWGPGARSLPPTCGACCWVLAVLATAPRACPAVPMLLSLPGWSTLQGRAAWRLRMGPGWPGQGPSQAGQICGTGAAACTLGHAGRAGRPRARWGRRGAVLATAGAMIVLRAVPTIHDQGAAGC